MNERLRCIAVFFSLGIALPTASADDFTSSFANTHDRIWIGPEFWANPMENWRIQDGRLECTSPNPDRNVQILTHQLTKKPGTLEMSVRVGLVEQGKAPGSAGFRIGIQDEIDDYRARLIHGGGFNAGINTNGALFFGKQFSKKTIDKAELAKGVMLRFTAKPDTAAKYVVTLSAHDKDGKWIHAVQAKLPAEQLYGNLALVNNHFGQKRAKKAGPRFWFQDWKISGTKVKANPEHKFGPILWSMYTLSNGVMKMTAQMPPIGKNESNHVELQTKSNGEWKTIAKANIDKLARTATFRIADWNDKQNTAYRLAYTMTGKDGKKTAGYWTGVVRQDPVDKKEIVVAGFTGNTDPGFPNREVARNVAHHNPDLLFFSGDQLYEGVGGYPLIREPVEPACLNYLRKWYLLGLAFRDLMRDRPTVTIPDDHDVYQGNIWGNGGNPISLKLHDAGGYVQHRDFVNVVHRTQCAHLPDPYDPTPIKQNISVYYCPYRVGKVGFAVLADRMFKSGPRQVATWKGRPDHVRDPKVDLKSLDKPGLKYLGDRQLKFLEQWVSDWKGVNLKCVLSQTIFCNLANYHGYNREYLIADLDSGGWPQTPRNNALKIMRKGFAFHYAGDQHLPSITHNGIETWGDCGFAFCVPSIAAGYPRSWLPDKEGRKVRNRPKGGPPNTGDYFDCFNHPTRVYAIANPKEKYRKGRLNTLHDKSSGYGLVRFNTEDRTITMECYKLQVDVSKPKKSNQFPGWPLTIKMTDNYGRKPAAYLPTLVVKNMSDPVVQVINEKTKEMVYTLRIQGKEFRPMVFEPGRYTVHVGELGTDHVRTLRGVEPAKGKMVEVVVP